MKLTQSLTLPAAFLLTLLAIPATTSAWHITFHSVTGDRVDAEGTQDVDCANLRGDYDGKTKQVYFDPETDWYPDPTRLTLFGKANCQGGTYTMGPGAPPFNPPKWVKSYKLE
ncbi:hypothetical protein FQN55_004142 [Onygenales sp. PD_40]|nr:hypothetical protein FQN55_004142 [Onygenales sp. PD_40]KAK2786629.1 hypothetical protein FQN53_006333 [Emmonsiellopsis sp. PD_33]KAK2792607.1 hypothetical protein FQN52_003112 [Onygenales sp. PD_12]KAK2801541.1 hypothetical protein FQN51_005248 [Onygenales sp. PD_10]